MTTKRRDTKRQLFRRTSGELRRAAPRVTFVPVVCKEGRRGGR